MRNWWLIGLFSLGLFIFSNGGQAGLQSLSGTPCVSNERTIFPKLIKGRTTVNGIYHLVKVAQPKHFEAENCQVETSEVGWQKVTYSFNKKAPLKVTLYSSTLGSLLWKTERTFTLNTVSITKNQGSKEIYDLAITDPISKIEYEFELNLETSRVKLRSRY